MSSGATALRASMAADVAGVERAALSSCATEHDAKHFVELAFKEPLEFPEGIKTIPKATLVVGAGKLERAKYEEELPKWVTTALRDLGFAEDRGASALPACAGTYKFQHDTGKNEKFVHVFPKIKLVKKETAGGDEEEGEVEEELTGSEKAEWLCIASNLETFKEMVAVKMGTWVCKKRVSKMLKDKDEELKAIEKKLLTRLALSPQEQKLFDATDQSVIEEKLAHLRGEMLKMVEEDKLTKKEREMALEQMRARLAEVPADSKQADSIKARIAQVEAKLSEKGYRVPLKFEDKMKHFWKRTIPMERIAEKAGPKGRWNPNLSQEEIRLLGEKEEMEAEILRLGALSRFWFEEEDELKSRMLGAKAMVKPSAASSSSSSSVGQSKAKSSSSGAGSGWSTVGNRPTQANGKSWSQVAGGNKAKGGAFAALGGDSDSDDD